MRRQPDTPAARPAIKAIRPRQPDQPLARKAGAIIADTKAAPTSAASCAGDCCTHAAPALGTLAASQLVAGGLQTAIRIMQMDCPVEETLIRKKLGNMPTVKQLEFNLMQRVLTVVHEPAALESILQAIRSLGFVPEVASADQPPPPLPAPTTAWWPMALGGGLALASELTHWFALPAIWPALLALLAIASCGLTTYRKGWIALRHANLNINALMSIAVTGALLIGQWPEAAMVMVLFSLAELIEAKSLDRARNAISGLLALMPETVNLVQADDRLLVRDAREVLLGNVVRVRPGERIGLDGIIVRGRSSLNQAAMTGESLPVEKGEGDTVFAGTINESGTLDYRVTAAANDTTLARIIHAVEAAQGAKAPTQRFVDHFARYYTPVVFGIALLVALLPPLLLGAAWLDWIYKGLVLLVIACPCALVISTPVTIVSGLAAAARQGILIKGGVYLEQGRLLRWLALDKTGTLTHGQPQQTDRVTLPTSNHAGDNSSDNSSDNNWYRLAASLASQSDHPVSRAIAAAAQREGISSRPVAEFTALPGRGVQGVIDGQSYALGNHRLVHERGLCSTALEAQLTALELQGKSVVLLIDDQRVYGLLAVADTVKASSRTAIDALHKLGIKTLMLSGDNPHTVATIAAQIGIDEARGDQLPDDKLQAITALSVSGPVGMVGDGINDSPALARADIGFAMGAMGTDTAIETADVALMDDDLRKIPAFIRLSQATHRILVQNIVLALGIKALFLALTLVGWGTLWMAVFADVGTSLLVVGNGLRLLRQRTP